MHPRLATALLAAAPLAFAAAAAQAQSIAEPVAVHRDWSVFAPTSPRECYIASVPTATTARRGNETVEVNRGDIRLFVTFRPTEGASNELSFAAGYPLRADSPVRLQVGDDRFTLQPGNGEGDGWAWPEPQQDETIVAALRRGSSATVTGVSQRGNTTVDTFSLMGFTAAIDDAAARCR